MIIKKFSCVLIAIILLFLGSCSEKYNNKFIYNGIYTDLGIPLLSQYPNDSEIYINARCIGDMQLYNGRIYIGSGDYDTNCGPVNVWYFDIEKNNWFCSDEMLPDEQIKRYFLFNGRLIISGTDPIDDWHYGNFYYMNENNEWITCRNIPSGIHCFDIIKFNGDFFAGLGVNFGDYPVVKSTDNCTTFNSVVFCRNGIPVETQYDDVIRVYNLFGFNGKLYAFLTLRKMFDNDVGNNSTDNNISFDLYCYNPDKNIFEFQNEIDTSFVGNYDIRQTASFNGKMHFINDYTYFVSDNLTAYTSVDIAENAHYSDMIVRDDALYILGAVKKSDTLYESMVFRSVDGISFERIIDFEYSVPAYSFEFTDTDFYFGMGFYDYNKNSADMGRILKIKY